MGQGQGIRSLKKSGNEGYIFALIEHYFSKSMKKS